MRSFRIPMMVGVGVGALSQHMPDGWLGFLFSFLLGYFAAETYDVVCALYDKKVKRVRA